jgi:Fur family ferric uptake transcriptional regulator
MAEATHADWLAHAERQLTDAGHRAGGARRAVLELLARQECCLSAQEIFDELRSEGRRVGIASVYRSLDLLASLKLVQRVEVGGSGGARYEPAQPGGAHHHHLICDACGEVAAFEDAQLEDALEGIAARLPYDVSAHEVVLHGACPTCR